MPLIQNVLHVFWGIFFSGGSLRSECVGVRIPVYCIYNNILDIVFAAQGWRNRTLAVHERVDSRFLVLTGSESTSTEITEYTFVSPLKPSRIEPH